MHVLAGSRKLHSRCFLPLRDNAFQVFSWFLLVFMSTFLKNMFMVLLLINGYVAYWCTTEPSNWKWLLFLSCPTFFFLGINICLCWGGVTWCFKCYSFQHLPACVNLLFASHPIEGQSHFTAGVLASPLTRSWKVPFPLILCQIMWIPELHLFYFAPQFIRLRLPVTSWEKV